MEENIKKILEKVNKIERALLNVPSEELNEYLDNVDKKDIIGVNNKLLYESFINNTHSSVKQNEFTKAIKKKFGLNLKHTNRAKKSIYYWSD